MDPKTTPQQPAPNGPVMDVQRPRPVAVAPAPAPIAQAPAVVEAPAEASSETAIPSGVSQATNPVSTTPPAKPKNKSSLPVALIAIVVVVVGALSAIAVFAYTKTKEPVGQADSAKPAVTTASQEAETASTEIDNSLKSIDDTTDFGDADLSDSSLGL